MNLLLFILLMAIIALSGLMPFFLLVTISIVLHELGHFLVAKKHGVRADGIQIGFGWQVISWRKVNGKWKMFFPKGKSSIDPKNYDAGSMTIDLDLLPLGGGCIFDDKKLNNMKPLHRIETFAAGPLVNLILAAVMMIPAYGILVGWKKSFHLFFNTIATAVPSLVEGIKMMFTSTKTMSESGQALSHMIANIPSAGTAILFVLVIAGILNLFLAIGNLIPIPGLDGGQILFAIPELFHKKINEKIVTKISNICVASLLCLSLIYIVRDCIMSIIK